MNIRVIQTTLLWSLWAQSTDYWVDHLSKKDWQEIWKRRAWQSIHNMLAGFKPNKFIGVLFKYFEFTKSVKIIQLSGLAVDYFHSTHSGIKVMIAVCVAPLVRVDLIDSNQVSTGYNLQNRMRNVVLTKRVPLWYYRIKLDQAYWGADVKKTRPIASSSKKKNARGQHRWNCIPCSAGWN